MFCIHGLELVLISHPLTYLGIAMSWYLFGHLLWISFSARLPKLAQASITAMKPYMERGDVAKKLNTANHQPKAGWCM